MTTAVGPYTDSWRRYSRWYGASIGLFVGYLPVFATLSALFPAILDNGVIFVLFIAYAGGWVAAANVARRWPCPRCGEYFFGSLWSLSLPMVLVRRCQSCGLRKYAPADPDPPTMVFTRPA